LGLKLNFWVSGVQTT